VLEGRHPCAFTLYFHLLPALTSIFTHLYFFKQQFIAT
jgi:hypothetical protein